MNTTKAILIFSFLTVWHCPSRGQAAADSLRRAAAMEAMRPSISCEMSARTGGDYDVRRDQQLMEEGSTGICTKAGVRAFSPVAGGKWGLVSASLRYDYIHQSHDQQMVVRDLGFGEQSHHLFGGNLMANVRTRLWGRPLVLVGTVGCEFSQRGYERWSAMGTAMLMLRQNSSTQLGVGLLCLVNTFSRFPVFPFFTYRHTFSPQWTLNLTLPRYHIAYTPSQSDKWSFGVGLDTGHFYLSPSDAGLPGHVRYSRLAGNIGPAFEHRFSRHLTVSAETGVSVIFSDRIREHNSSKELATVGEAPSAYFKIGLTQRF